MKGRVVGGREAPVSGEEAPWVMSLDKRGGDPRLSRGKRRLSGGAEEE
jgi:hypothetical protein